MPKKWLYEKTEKRAIEQRWRLLDTTCGLLSLDWDLEEVPTRHPDEEGERDTQAGDNEASVSAEQTDVMEYVIEGK